MSLSPSNCEASPQFKKKESTDVEKTNIEDTIDQLVNLTGSKSRDELLRRAIALMKIAAEAQSKGKKIVIEDENRQFEAELQIY